MQLRLFHQTILVEPGRGSGRRPTSARRPLHERQAPTVASAKETTGVGHGRVGVKVWLWQSVGRRRQAQTVFRERRKSAQVHHKYYTYLDA